jgi:hypothetical protein
MRLIVFECVILLLLGLPIHLSIVGGVGLWVQRRHPLEN